MSTFDWPSEDAFATAQADWWLDGVDQASTSLLNGATQTSAVPGARWRVALSFDPDHLSARRLRLLGFLRQLNGREHRLSLWDVRKFGRNNVHGAPAGTVATSGVTVHAAAAQFASSLQLAGCGAGATLEPGDMVGVANQLIECPVLCTANGSGVLTLPVPQRLRAAAAAGEPVTTLRPTARFILAEPFHGPRNGQRWGSFAIDLVEAFT